MYSKNDTTYASAGSVLTGADPNGIKHTAYQLPNTYSPFTESPINIDDVKVFRNGTAGTGDVLFANHRKWGYEQWKNYFIGLRYTLVEQVITLFDKEEKGVDSTEEYDLLIKWREWSGLMADKMIELNKK